MRVLGGREVSDQFLKLARESKHQHSISFCSAYLLLNLRDFSNVSVTFDGEFYWQPVSSRQGRAGSSPLIPLRLCLCQSKRSSYMLSLFTLPRQQVSGRRDPIDLHKLKPYFRVQSTVAPDVVQESLSHQFMDLFPTLGLRSRAHRIHFRACISGY